MGPAALLLMLASAEALSLPEPPKGPLVCRYETVVSRLVSRRKLCLTEAEWAERDRMNSEASRRSIYELMGNTACMEGGLCTD
jgi:hypothetical protein